MGGYVAGEWVCAALSQPCTNQTGLLMYGLLLLCIAPAFFLGNDEEGTEQTAIELSTVRLCGSCSVGHCPDCGTQLLPGKLVLEQEEKGNVSVYDVQAAINAGEKICVCPGCGYQEEEEGVEMPRESLSSEANNETSVLFIPKPMKERMPLTFDDDV